MIFFQVPIPQLEIGDTAPNISLHRHDGSTLKLSQLKCKVVVLEFTSLNCPSCRELDPKLEAFAAKYPDVVFLTISTDSPADSAKLLAIRPKNAKTVFVEDYYNKDRSKMGVWQYGNVGTPSLYVIGPSGQIASHLMQQGVDSLPHLAERIAWAKAHPDYHSDPSPSGK